MNKSETIKLTQILISLVLFAFSFLIKDELTLLIYNIINFLIISIDVIYKCLIKIIHLNFFQESLLMLVASICAFAIKEYSEGIIVLTLYQLGDLFEEISTKKSKKNIKELLEVKPKTAHLLVNNELKETKPENLKVDDIIIIKPYEKIPTNSIIISGESSINESSLTGEYKLKDVKENDLIYSGTINENGTLKARVVKEFKDSEVAKILKLITEADNKKTKSEKFVAKFAKIYTPVVITLAILIASICPFIFKDKEVIYFLKMACQFLVISCPCALVISVPLASFLAVGSLSKKGILVKGMSYLETLSNIDMCVFDKTGTLTKGEFKIKQILTENIKEEELLNIAKIAMIRSTHPLAKAIVKNEQINEDNIEDYKEIPGQGVSLTYKGNIILAGNKRLLNKNNIEINENSIDSKIHIAMNQKYIGTILLEDEIKESSKPCINKLKKKNIKTALLSGDNNKIVENIKNELNIDIAKGELKPEDKVKELEEMLKTNKVSYIGEGVNDSPSLKRADVGISMGSLGSDVAIECSDVIIMDDDLNKIDTLINTSKKTKRVILFNIIFILFIKISVIIISLFYQNFYLAILSDVGVSIIAILNSMQLLRQKE